MKSNFPGKLIVVEGLDGSGKSTQIYLLKKWLENQSLKVFFTEWNSSLLVKPATSKGKKRHLLTPSTFSLIHATDFSDRYDRFIVPLLKAGYIVLADRYIYTAYVRDFVRKCNPEWVKNLYSFAITPDLTFYFKLNPETAVNRILVHRKKLKFFEAGMDLNLSTDIVESFSIIQDRISNLYDSLADEYMFNIIDGSQPIHLQQKIVRDLVSKTIDLSSFAKGFDHA